MKPATLEDYNSTTAKWKLARALQVAVLHALESRILLANDSTATLMWRTQRCRLNGRLAATAAASLA